jgi:hypothetical protein
LREAHSYSYSDTGFNADSLTYRHAYSNSNGNTYCNCHSYSYTDVNRYSERDSYANCASHTYSKVCADPAASPYAGAAPCQKYRGCFNLMCQASSGFHGEEQNHRWLLLWRGTLQSGAAGPR